MEIDPNKEVEEFKEKCINLGSKDKLNLHGGHLYALTRRTEPDIVVESVGVGGLSTFMILKALEKNKHGKLYTFDPTGAKELKGIINESLKERWEYIPQNILNSKEKLGELIGDINVFYSGIGSSNEVFDEFKLMSKYVSYDGKYTTPSPVEEKIMGNFDLLRALHNDKNQVIMNGFKVFVD